MRNRWLAATLAAAMLGTALVGSTWAAGKLAPEGALPPKEQMIWSIAERVLAKGDDAVLALARLAKVRLFLEKLQQPQKAVEELEALDKEVTDQEIRIVVALLKIVVMEQAKVAPQEQLAALDRMIAATKERAAK